MVLGRWPWACAVSLGVAAGASAIALGANLVSGLGSRVGPTLLASAADAAAGIHQPVMLAAIALASLVFVAAALRLEARRRAGEAVVLGVSGWTRAQIRVLMWSGLVPIGLVAAGLAGVAAGALAGPLDAWSPLPPNLVASLLAASVVVWGRLAARDVAASPTAVA
jgi:hypothetical protein